MLIAVIGDVHDHQQRLGQVLEWAGRDPVDLALLVGDVGLDPPWDVEGRTTGRADHDASVRRVLGRVVDRLGRPLAFVPGNHDLRDAVEVPRATNCDGRIVEIAGLRIAGFGGAGPTRFGFPYEWREAEADRALRRLLGGGEAPDVLISHSPPGPTTLDRTHRGLHVGSPAVRRWIGRARPRLVVCGHIHEAAGVERVRGVTCLNAGALGEPHGDAIVWLVEWTGNAASSIRSLSRTPDGSVRVREWA